VQETIKSAYYPTVGVRTSPQHLFEPVFKERVIHLKKSETDRKSTKKKITDNPKIFFSCLKKQLRTNEIQLEEAKNAKRDKGGTSYNFSGFPKRPLTSGSLSKRHLYI